VEWNRDLLRVAHESLSPDSKWAHGQLSASPCPLRGAGMRAHSCELLQSRELPVGEPRVPPTLGLFRMPLLGHNNRAIRPQQQINRCGVSKIPAM
jgi:hypothetical protein